MQQPAQRTRHEPAEAPDAPWLAARHLSLVPPPGLRPCAAAEAPDAPWVGGDA